MASSIGEEWFSQRLGKTDALSMRLSFAEASNRANAGSLWRMGTAVPDESGVLGSIGEMGLSVSVSIEVVWLMTVLVVACVLLL
jgi:hypothetical protein